MTIISVQNNKGGLGKTSLVTNIAGVLSEQGNRVLIIDTDGQGNVALTFGVKPDELSFSIYDVLIDNYDPKGAIKNVSDNLDILPSNSDMDFFDMEVLTNVRKKYKNPFYLLRNNLRGLSEEYDYIIIDSPPSLGLIAGNIFSYTDYVVIPFQPELYAVRGLLRLKETVESFRESHNPNLSILGVTGMMIDSRTSLHKEMMTQAKDYLTENNITLFETVIPRSIRFASSVAYENKPAIFVDKNNNLVNAYYELTSEILEHLNQ